MAYKKYLPTSFTLASYTTILIIVTLKKIGNPSRMIGVGELSENRLWQKFMLVSE
jgi:hypothetical protein